MIRDAILIALALISLGGTLSLTVGLILIIDDARDRAAERRAANCGCRACTDPDYINQTVTALEQALE